MRRFTLLHNDNVAHYENVLYISEIQQIVNRHSIFKIFLSVELFVNFIRMEYICMCMLVGGGLEGNIEGVW